MNNVHWRPASQLPRNWDSGLMFVSSVEQSLLFVDYMPYCKMQDVDML